MRLLELLVLLGVIDDVNQHTSKIKSVGFDQYSKYTVSTVNTPDNGWETALFRPDDGQFYVVEFYDNENDAIAGHVKWCESIEKETKAPLLHYNWDKVPKGFVRLW